MAESAYREMVMTLPTGLTFIALHCNTPGDIETIVPLRAHWRTDEYQLFKRSLVKQWLEAAGVRTHGYRELRDRLRAPSLVNDLSARPA